MEARIILIVVAAVFVLSTAILLHLPQVVFAHCDTMDGPVVTGAKAALESGEVTPVLKWVKPEHEAEIRAAFERTLAVRTKGPEARQLADMYFFESLVRVHREGEGEAYTGLKPAGSELSPAVVGADNALETGSVDDVVNLVTNLAAEGIRDRFARTLEAKKHMNDSVEAGREYVEAYVEYVHYVDRLYTDGTTRAAEHAAHEAAAEAGHVH